MHDAYALFLHISKHQAPEALDFYLDSIESGALLTEFMLCVISLLYIPATLPSKFRAEKTLVAKRLINKTNLMRSVKDLESRLDQPIDHYHAIRHFRQHGKTNHVIYVLGLAEGDYKISSEVYNLIKAKVIDDDADNFD